MNVFMGRHLSLFHVAWGACSPNKRFKRDSQRAAFSLCVSFYGYGVMRKVSRGVGCPLSGRYV